MARENEARQYQVERAKGDCRKGRARFEGLAQQILQAESGERCAEDQCAIDPADLRQRGTGLFGQGAFRMGGVLGVEQSAPGKEDADGGKQQEEGDQKGLDWRVLVVTVVLVGP